MKPKQERQESGSIVGRIRNDPTLLITYGYIVVCLLGITVGLVYLAFVEFWWGSIILIGLAIVGLEAWTGWGEMRLRDYRRT